MTPRGGGAVLTITPQANSTLQKAPAKAPAANTTAVSENAVAVIGSTEYSSLDKAIDAAQSGDTITLQKNVKGYFPIENKTLTIDLNGKTVTADTSDRSYLGAKLLQAFLITGGNITIKNGTITGANAVGHISEYNSIKGRNEMTYHGGPVSVHDGATVTLDGLTVTGNKGTGMVVLGDSILRLEGCKIVNNHGVSDLLSNASYNYGMIYLWRKASAEKPGILIMNNTEVSGNTGVATDATLNLKGGSATITNCDIKDNTAYRSGGIYFSPLVDDAALTLTNTTVSGNTGCMPDGVGVGGLYVGGGSLSFSNSAVYNNSTRSASYPASDIVLDNISDGLPAASEMVDHGTKLEGYVYRNCVTGAILEGEIPAAAHALAQDQYDVIKKPASTEAAWEYGAAKYGTLSAAINAYIADSGAGGAIKLLQDVEEFDTLPAVGTVANPVKIDLGGFTLASPKNSLTTITFNGKSYISFENGAIANGRVGIEVKTTSSHVTLQNVTIKDCARNAVLSPTSVSATDPTILKASNCTFQNNGFSPSVNGSSTTKAVTANDTYTVKWMGHFEITNCTFTENQAGLLFKSTYSTAAPTLTGTTFSKNKGPCFTSETSGLAKNMTIENCDFIDNDLSDVLSIYGTSSSARAVIYLAVKDRTLQFTNCNITGNAGGAKTVDINAASSATFTRCVVSDNKTVGFGTTYTGFPVGGIYTNSASTTLRLALSVVKNNVAETTYATATTGTGSYIPTGGVHPSGPLSITGNTSSGNSAYYGNVAISTATPDMVANDIFIAKGKSGSGPYASRMKDRDFDFSKYVWTDPNEANPITGAISGTNSTRHRLLTAEIDESQLNIAKIGDTEYKTLEEAFDAAQDGDTIRIIIKDQKPSIMNISPAAITVDKNVTLDLRGVTLNGSANPQLTVQSGVEFTLKDTLSDEYEADNTSNWEYPYAQADHSKMGGVSKKIVVEDDATLNIESSIAVSEIVHSGEKLSIAKPLAGTLGSGKYDEQVIISLAEGKYAELGEVWDEAVAKVNSLTKRVVFKLAQPVLDKLNDTSVELDKDVVVTHGGGRSIKNYVEVDGITASNVRMVYVETSNDPDSSATSKLVLRKDLKGIYLDEVGGDKIADGGQGTIDKPVNTFEEAHELLLASPDAEGIIVKNVVRITDATTWDLSDCDGKNVLYRWDEYKGNLVNVTETGELTLTNIIFDGQGSEGIEAGEGNAAGDGSLIYVDPHGKLTLSNGSVLKNNWVQTRNGYTSCGGAIYSAGEVVIESSATSRPSASPLRKAAPKKAPAATSAAPSISSNRAVMGGGIYQVGKVRDNEESDYTGKLTMTSGTIGQNYAMYPEGRKQASILSAGGGVMLAYGADMCFGGGSIVGNVSYNIGGGISLGTTGDAATTCLTESGTTTLSMYGNSLIDKNTASSEGGGIYVQINAEAYVSAGTISNNIASGYAQYADPAQVPGPGQAVLGRDYSHGGGGIYVNGCSTSYYNNNIKSAGAQYKGYNAGILYLSDAEIAYNKTLSAVSYGGSALAFCASGDANLFELHGGVIHDNQDRYGIDVYMTMVDHQSGARIGTLVDNLSYYVTEFAIDGTPYDWEYFPKGNYRPEGDSVPVTDPSLIQYNNKRIMLHTDLSENTTDLTEAIAATKVHILNNSSTYYGGGIGSNGAVVSGYESPKIDVAAEKKWANDTALTANDKRPETVKFILQRKAADEADSAFVNIKEAVVNGQEDNWKVKFTDLPEYKEYSGSSLPNSEACPDCVNGADAENVKWVYRIVEDETYKPEVDGSLLWKGADATDSKAIADVYKVETKAGDDTERDAKDVPEGYTLNDGVITQKNFTTTNTLKTGELEVAKTVTGDGADANKAFSFTVTLDTKALNNIKLNGTFGDMTFADNEATFALKGGESKTAKGLPAGVSYTVVEADYSADGYTTTKTGDTGTIEADKTASAAFTNYNPGTAAGKLEVEKLLKGDAGMLAAADLPEFTFELVPDDASNPMPKQATVSIKGADFVDGLGTASFDEITFAKAGTYTYTLSEQEPSPLPAGWTYNTEKQKYTVVYDVTDTGTGLSTTRTIRNVTSEQVNKAVFENDFKATPTKETISVEKTVSAGAPDAEFVFRVNPQNGAPEPAGDNECRITGAGSVDFGEITFTQPGEYTYEVAEVATNKAGWTYDETVYTVTYKVSLNSDAQLVAQRTISKDSEGGVEAITFANTYEQKDGTADGIEVQKKLSASVQPTEKQSFEFLITAKTEGAPMPEANTVSVEGGGTAAFGTIEFSKPGTYTYTVTEVQPNPVPEGYTYDTAEFTVSYTVEDHDAKLVVAKTEITKAGEAASGVEFTNTFAAGPVEESIEVKKIVSGNPEEDETFTFEIEAEEGTTVLPDALQVQVKGAGTASFGPLNFTTTGKFAYIVREVPGANAAYTYDATAYRVEFNVEEQDGKLVATRSTTQADEAAGGALAFTNTYTPEEPEPEYTPSVPVEVVMIKHLKDALIHEEEFSFGLYNEDGQQQGEAIHTTLGIKTNPQEDFYTSYVEIKFAGLSYTEPGVYNYTIREHVDGTTQVVEGDEWNQAGFEPGFYKGGVKYDDKEYPVVVTVVPTANGQLEASVAYPTADGDVHELVNEYSEDYIEIDEFDSHPNDGLHEPEPEETDKPTPPADTTKKDSPKTPTTKPSPKTGSVRTGDTNPVAPLSLLALVAAATAGFAFARRRNAKGTGHLA